MVIDFHAHVWGAHFIPDAFHMDTARRWASKDDRRKPEMVMPKLVSGIVDEDGHLFIENMDRAGVDVTVINMVDYGIHWSGEEPGVPPDKQLEFYRDLQERYPNRIMCFAFIDPRRGDCVNFLERAFTEYGFAGCGEFSAKGLAVSDPAAQIIFEKCLELNVPVYIHTRAGEGTEIASEDYSRYNTTHPFHIESLQIKYPSLRIILGHAGYSVWWEEACRIARGNPNCYLELSNWNLDLGKPDELIPKLACMRDMVGADHILFGSDQPSGNRFCGTKSTLANWVTFFKNLPDEGKKYGYQFSNREVNMILGENAQTILNL